MFHVYVSKHLLARSPAQLKSKRVNERTSERQIVCPRPVLRVRIPSRPLELASARSECDRNFQLGRARVESIRARRDHAGSLSGWTMTRSGISINHHTCRSGSVRAWLLPAPLLLSAVSAFRIVRALTVI